MKKKSKWWILATFVVLAISASGAMLLFQSCERDPFANSSISLSTSSVSLKLDMVENNGSVTPSSKSKVEHDVKVNLRKMPKGISHNLQISSDNDDIATAQKIPNTTTVRITGHNGGETKIRVTAIGGLVAVINVKVDVPAKKIALFDYARFGAIKGETAPLHLEDFDFYAYETATDKSFKTTQKNVQFDFTTNKPQGFEIIETNGNYSLQVPNYTLLNKIDLKATLRDYPTASIPFTVHLLEPFLDTYIKVGNSTPTTESNIDLSLVNNKYTHPSDPNQSHNPNIIQSQNFTVSVKNTKYILGKNYGYDYENDSLALAGVENVNETTGAFQIFAHRPGNGVVTVCYFPMVEQATGGYLYFDRPYDAHLQQKKYINYSVRNVFSPDNQLLADTSNNKLSVYDDSNDTTKFTLSLQKSIEINNPRGHEQNSNIYFVLKRNGVALNTKNSLSILPANAINPSIGVSYNREFSILLQDTSLYGTGDFVLEAYAVNVKNAKNENIKIAEIGLDLLRSLKSINVHTTSTETEIIDSVYPIMDTLSGHAFDFYIDPISLTGALTESEKLNHIKLEFENEAHKDLFTIVKNPNLVDNRIHYTISVTNPNDINVSVNAVYPLRVIYAGGFEIPPLNVIPLLRLDGITTSKIRNEEKGYVYDATMLKGGLFNLPQRAVVRTDGKYSLELGLYPSTSNVFISNIFSDGTTYNGNGIFNADVPGVYDMVITLSSPNINVLSVARSQAAVNTDYQFSMRLFIVNPLTDASVDKEELTGIISRETLHSTGIADNPEKSYKNINLSMIYYRDILDTNLPTVTTVSNTSSSFADVLNPNQLVTPKMSFNIRGLRSTEQLQNGYVSIEFIVEQIIDPALVNDERIVIFTTTYRPIKVNVYVQNAIKVETLSFDGGSGSTGTSIYDMDISHYNSHYVNVNMYPAASIVTDNRKGYAFELNNNGVRQLVDKVYDNDNNLIAEVLADGTLKAYKTNYDTAITLVVYSLDSVRDGHFYENGGNYYGMTGSGSAGDNLIVVYSSIKLNIFDSTTSFVVRSSNEFMKVFYKPNAVNVPNQGIAYVQRDDLDMVEYVRLAADIDLSVLSLMPITGFKGILTGASPYAISDTESSQYSITNYRLGSYYQSGETNERYYGLFHNLLGTIDSVTFKDYSTTNNELNFSSASYGSKITIGGIASSVGETGEIKNVKVDINGIIRLGNNHSINFGGIAGVNGGKIHETSGLNVSGRVEIRMAGEDGSETINVGGFIGHNQANGKLLGAWGGMASEQNIPVNSTISLAVSRSVGNFTDITPVRNLGAIAGLNSGEIRNMSSETLLFNSARGNTGGLVGENDFGAIIENCYANTGVHARGAIGGLVGRNKGILENSFFDFYINKQLINSFEWLVELYYDTYGYGYPGLSAPFYAGLVAAGPSSSNTGGVYLTAIGGVAGRNDGTIDQCVASSAFVYGAFDGGEPEPVTYTAKHTTVNGVQYKGDIFINQEAAGIYVGGLVGHSASGTIERCFSQLSVQTGLSVNNPKIGGIVGKADGTDADPSYEIDLCSYNMAYKSAIMSESVVVTDAIKEVPKDPDTSAELLNPTVNLIGSLNSGAYEDLLRDLGLNYLSNAESLTFKLYSADKYDETFGKTMNDRSWFNYVALSDDGIPALFYTDTKNSQYLSGSFATANKYYMDDLFSLITTPALASKRIDYKIEWSSPTIYGASVAKVGFDTVNGYTRQYVMVMGTGQFELSAYATKTVDASPEALGKIKFYVIEGAKLLSVTTTAGYGQVARKNLLTSHRDNYANDFAVRKTSPFSMGSDLVAKGRWQVETTTSYQIKGQSHNYNNGGNGYPYNGELVSWLHESGQPYKLINFNYKPYYKPDYVEIKFYCSALETDVTAHFYEGATEFNISQTDAEFNSSASVDFVGTISTDAVKVTHPSPANKEEAKQNVMDLINFSFRLDGNNNLAFDLFKNGQTRTEISDSDNRWKLIFTLEDVQYEKLLSSEFYWQYTYQINMAIEVGMYQYQLDSKGNIIGVTPAMPQGMTGRLIASENGAALDNAIGSDGSEILQNLELQTDFATVEIVTQSVEVVNFTHLPKTETVKTQHYDSAMRVVDEQIAKDIIYLDSIITGGGGLLMVHINPGLSTLSKIELLSSRTECGNYEIYFSQLVKDITDPNNPLYVQRKFEGGYIPVSTLKRNGANIEYGWDGNFYFSTMIVDVNGSSTNVEPKTVFEITVSLSVLDSEATQTSGTTYKIISNKLELNDFPEDKTITPYFSLTVEQRPGVVFNYDGNPNYGVQAVGTSHHFDISFVGNQTEIASMQVFTVDPLNDDVSDKLVESLELTSLLDVTEDAWIIPARDENGTLTVGTYILRLPTDLELAEMTALVGKQVRIDVRFKTMEVGNTVESINRLTVDIVLFKINEIYIQGVSSRLMLRPDNTQGLQLRIDPDYYRGDSEFTKSIEVAITEFEDKMTRDEKDNILWRGAGEQGLWFVLNNSALEVDGNVGYYRNTEAYNDHLNFAFGKNLTLGNKLLFPIIRDNRSETGHLSFMVDYSYSNPGNPGIPLLVRYGTGINRSGAIEFEVITTFKTSTNYPTIIRNNQKGHQTLRNMEAGEHYILMEDIIINQYENWKPIDFVAASLDGNNKRVILNGYDLTQKPENIGLFSTIAEGSLIKNLNLVLPNYGALTDSTLEIDLSRYDGKPTVSVGILAGINNGIVTNCAVLVEEQSIAKQFDGHKLADYDKSYAKNSNAAARLAVYVRNKELTLNVGGLVGLNEKTGVISNSRVLVDIYVGSMYRDDNLSTSNVETVKQTSVGGFVGTNSGTIVSSFFRDASIRNDCGASVINGNATAGFVATNNGTIKTCYAMGMTHGLNSQNGATKYGSVFVNRGDAAGFVFMNKANVEDCYVSMRLTGGLHRMGFVAINENTGTIKNCFMNAPANEGGSGVDSHALSSGEHFFSENKNTNPSALVNNKYTNPILATQIEGQVELVTQDKLALESSFHGFSLSGIWKMTEQGPRLAATDNDNIAISIRVDDRDYLSEFGSTVILYHDSFALGSAINPLLIFDGFEFNEEIYEMSGAQQQYLDAVESSGVKNINFDRNLYTGHVRLINYIQLEGTLNTYQVTYSSAIFDGNGFSIKGITLVAEEELVQNQGLDSVGLFSKIIDNATIKNVKLELKSDDAIQGSIQAPWSTYVGALAGTIENSQILNVEVIGSQVSTPTGTWRGDVEGRNITGGLVGMAIDSIIEYAYITNITTTSKWGSGAVGDFESISEYLNRPDYEKRGQDEIGKSITGGIIGKAVGETSIKHIGSNPGTNQVLQAEIVGGLIGFVDEDVIVKYITSTVNKQLRGKYYIGGLVGINFGTIETGATGGVLTIRSYSTASGDGAPKDYIFGTKLNAIGMTVGGAVGYNSGLVKNIISGQNGIAAISINSGGDHSKNIHTLGGLVGDNYGGTLLENKITIANWSNLNGGFYVGGLVGFNFDGSVPYLEADPMRNIITTPALPSPRGAITDIFAIWVDVEGNHYNSAGSDRYIFFAGYRTGTGGKYIHARCGNLSA